jgi:hypothetical protein
MQIVVLYLIIILVYSMFVTCKQYVYVATYYRIGDLYVILNETWLVL